MQERGGAGFRALWMHLQLFGHSQIIYDLLSEEAVAIFWGH